MLLVAEVNQGVQPIDTLHNDITATPAIAAIRATVFNKFFTVEANGTAPARAGTDVDFGQIEEFHIMSLVQLCAAKLVEGRATSLICL